MVEARVHGPRDAWVAHAGAELQRENGGGFVVPLQRIEQRPARRRNPERVRSLFGLQPATAQHLVEGLTVVTVEPDEHEHPDRRHHGRADRDGRVGHVQHVEHHD